MNYDFVDMKRVHGIIIGGGRGTRMLPLTLWRTKPAVPIGGNNRLIDIAISNFLNSEINHISIIVQSKPGSLIRHLEGYQNAIAQMRDEFIRVLVPFDDNGFFKSDANSLLQLKAAWASADFDVMVISMADQIVKVDYRQIVKRLMDTKADAVLVHKEVPVGVARNALGVVQTNKGQVIAMDEKPAEPIESSPGMCQANIAMYAITREAFFAMIRQLENHAESKALSRTGIPWLIDHFQVVGYRLQDNSVPGASSIESNYFVDTASVDAWYRAQLDMCRRVPVFNFYSQEWPIFTSPRFPTSPVKLDSVSKISEVLFGPNVICQDRVTINKSVISRGVLVGSDSIVNDSVVLDNCVLGSGCRLHQVVIEKSVTIPSGMELSPASAPDDTIPFAELYEQVLRGEQVHELHPVLTNEGILVIPKGYRFD